MKKYSRKRIGFKTVTSEGYVLHVVDGSERMNYCTITLDGRELEAQVSSVVIGNVRNRMHPSVLGVGYLGYGEFEVTKCGKITPAYTTWASMLERCYDEKYLKRYPTYRGCTVHSDWHNFQVFGEWFESNYIEGYHLDKDIKTVGNRIYSADACMFVTPSDNVINAHAKHYQFLSPQGKLIEVYNLRSFCRENTLNQANMSMVHAGKRNHHKQWRKANKPIQNILPTSSA